jgi:hypothetical protein
MAGVEDGGVGFGQSLLVIEVLSPSTVNFDRVTKPPKYMTEPGLQALRPVTGNEQTKGAQSHSPNRSL